MPKSLRFKKSDRDHKKHKRRKRHHHHDEHSSGKEKPYRPPTLYENEDGWEPPETMNKERDDEAEWREKLFSAMAEDEGGDSFYSQYMGPSSNRSGVDSMTDEEYRRHIVSEMHQKQNAEAIKQQKAREAAKKNRERERKKAQEEIQKEEAKSQRIREEQRRHEHLRQNKESRKLYIEQWERLEQTTDISKKDIPWPTLGPFSLEGVRDFIVDPSQPASENKKTVRKEQLRYHPDKFIQRVLSKVKVSPKEHERLCAKTNEISGWLNELWAELCT